MVTKYELSYITKAVRKEQAKESAPCLVAEIKMIAASSPYGSDQKGRIATWNDRTHKVECDYFEVGRSTGTVRWNFRQYIDQAAFTRRIEAALIKGGVLTIGAYAAVLDGTWHGLTKTLGSIVGGCKDWPILQEESYEDVREELLALAATELTALPGTV